MKKSIFKIVIILVLVLAILNICLIPVMAAIDPNAWKPSNTVSLGSVGNKAGVVLGVVQVVGIIVAVVALVMIGIKYLTGSAEEKAEYKKTMIPYIIGATMLFAASTLVQIIYNWATTLNN